MNILCIISRLRTHFHNIFIQKLCIVLCIHSFQYIHIEDNKNYLYDNYIIHCLFCETKINNLQV